MKCVFVQGIVWKLQVIVDDVGWIRIYLLFEFYCVFVFVGSSLFLSVIDFVGVF